MDESFGARLRQRREAQGIDLIAIAAQTKIKMSLLDALERDDVSHWPAGIFRRAYIRTYAQAIGLDPDGVLREFLDVHPEPAEVVTTEALASVVDSTRYPGGPPTRLRYIVGSAFSSLARLRRAPSEELPSTPVIPVASVEPPRASQPGLSTARPVIAEPMDLGITLMTEPLTEEPYGEQDETFAVSEEPYVEPDSDALEVDLPAPAVEAVMSHPTPEPPAAPQFAGPDFMALAKVCTAFGQVQDAGDLGPLLREAAGILGARGAILWLWDPMADGLRAALAHGYSDRVLAQLPVVGREAENATAAAFRRGQTCTTAGDAHTNSAVVLPLLTGAGCVGVLAVELPHGHEHDPSVRAAATILAAMLAQLAGAPSSHEDVDSEPEMAGAHADVEPAAARYRA